MISTRLQVKHLEDRLQELQLKIEKQGIGISESIEKDIFMIMIGQNLDATPHMKFLWQEQMKFLQAVKMGRRYHFQIISSPFPFIENPHQHMEIYKKVAFLFSLVKEFCETVRTVLS